MSRKNGQKLKLIYLLQLLWEQSDEEHPISMKEILSRLNESVSAERKGIYDDIAQLNSLGLFEIQYRKEQPEGYYISGRNFELAELKILADAIQCSKFITAKKSDQLIQKIGKLTSCYEAEQLNHHVHITNHVKADNEKIYYTIDDISRAMEEDCQITFQYYHWSVNKEKIYRYDGKRYQVSPWALIWNDEQYYLVAYDDQDNKVKHYRVDKMENIDRILLPRLGKQQFADFDMGKYTKKTFSMYGGQDKKVRMQFHNNLIGVIFDQFGHDIWVKKVNEDHFEIQQMVSVSDQFYGWMFGLGEEAKIVGPEEVVEEYRRKLEQRWNMYHKRDSEL